MISALSPQFLVLLTIIWTNSFSIFLLLKTLHVFFFFFFFSSTVLNKYLVDTISNCVQLDLSNLDLETLAPYIPMDGEDFQLHPICLEEPVPDTSPGLSKALQHSFSSVADLFQPLSPFPPDNKSGPNTCPDTAHAQPYQTATNVPLSSEEGRQNLQWPPDPPSQYERTDIGCMDDRNTADPRQTCSFTAALPQQRWTEFIIPLHMHFILQYMN